MNLDRALQILELKSYRGPDDLKKAFRALAHRHHPDKNPGRDSAEAFRAAIASYEFCLDHLDDVARRFGAVPGAKATERDRLYVANLDDIFEDIFGFSKLGRVMGYREPTPVELTLKELLFGGVKRVKLVAYEPCPDCKGTGAAKGALARICRHCFGQGAYERKSDGGSTRKVCPQCRGRGREMEKSCERCDGYGRLRETRLQEFAIPPGLKSGSVASLSAKDAATGRDTEVCVIFNVKRDAIFQIENHDLICEYRMDFSSHRTDRVLNVETPFGIRQAELGKQARSGDVITIKNAGLYKDMAKTGQGDLKVVLRHRGRSWWERIRDALRGKPRGGNQK